VPWSWGVELGAVTAAGGKWLFPEEPAQQVTVLLFCWPWSSGKRGEGGGPEKKGNFQGERDRDNITKSVVHWPITDVRGGVCHFPSCWWVDEKRVIDVWFGKKDCGGGSVQ